MYINILRSKLTDFFGVTINLTPFLNNEPPVRQIAYNKTLFGGIS